MTLASPARACGIDFGTSNSTVGWLRPGAGNLIALEDGKDTLPDDEAPAAEEPAEDSTEEAPAEEASNDEAPAEEAPEAPEA